GDLTAVDTTVTALGVTRRAVLTHSPTLHAGQSRGLDQTLAKARARLAELQARLRRGNTRRPRAKVEADIAAICKPRWVGQIITATLTGDEPATFRLSWRTNTRARAKLEQRLFGKRILFTNRDTWPVADIVAAYRSQSEAERCKPQCCYNCGSLTLWVFPSGSVFTSVFRVVCWLASQDRCRCCPRGTWCRARSRWTSPGSACTTHRRGASGWRWARTQPRATQVYRVIWGMSTARARSASHHSCSPSGGRVVRVVRAVDRPRVPISLRTPCRPKRSRRLGGRNPSRLSWSAIWAALCPAAASCRTRAVSCGEQLSWVRQATGRTTSASLCCPPAQATRTVTRSLVASASTRTCSTSRGSSCLRSALVVVGACHSAGMSVARARMWSRSAAVRVRGRAAVKRSYSSPRRCRWASAASQSASSWRTTRRFSGSASW